MRGEFEWDAAKDVANRQAHGMSLAEAMRLDWAAALIRPDLRFDYGEMRFSALGPMDGRLCVCIFTMRDGRHRIISLRKANAREVRDYEHATSR
jgi:uncharacterized DUF497 family protein